MLLRLLAIATLALLAIHRDVHAQNTWEIRHDYSPRTLRFVFAMRGGMVALGKQGLVLGSDDGLHWTDRSRPSWRDIRGAACDSTELLVVDNQGGIWNSSDKGYTWSFSGNFPVPDSIQSMAGRDGLWMVGATNGNIWRSTDGATWEANSSGTNLPIRSLASNGSTWVAVGGNNNNDAVLLVSDDSRTWKTVPWTYPNPVSYKVIYWKGKFVTPTLTRLRWSEDGHNWSSFEATSSTGQKMFANDSFLWDGKRLLSSLDSGTHTAIAFQPPSQTVVGFGSQFVSYGYTQEIYHSADGNKWKSVHDSSMGRSTSATTDGKRIVSNMYSSPDGRWWSPSNPFGVDDVRLTTVRWTQGSFFLGGDYRYWSKSADGQTWDSVKTLPLTSQPFDGDEGAVWDYRTLADTLLAITPVEPLQSMDSGKTWQIRSTTPLPPHRIPWPGKGTWVSLSTQAIQSTSAYTLAVAVSYDGLRDTTKSKSMEVVSNKLDYSLHGNAPLLAASPKRVVFIAQTTRDANPGIGYTDDATTLQLAEVPRLGSVFLNALTWTGSQFVAVGDKGTILVSGDGTRWSRVDSGRTKKNLNALVVADSTLYAFGDSGIILASRLEPSVGIRSLPVAGRFASWTLKGRILTIRSDAGHALRDIALLDAAGRTLAQQKPQGASEATLTVPTGFRGLGLVRIRTDRGETMGRVAAP
ncbi:MAG: hypothetical protein IPK50_05025 [Fibrobacterota bacterium]|nr:hypothetical protein [Fibrobacterota bacterium]QQS06257.1 MAG: hypothetical protein IPK50_05025 [Fibrobacterota bacterium]